MKLFLLFIVALVCNSYTVECQFSPEELYEDGYSYINRTINGPWCNNQSAYFKKVHQLMNAGYDNKNWHMYINVFSTDPNNASNGALQLTLEVYTFNRYLRDICAFNEHIVWKFPSSTPGLCIYTVENFDVFIQPPYISTIPPSYVANKASPDCAVLGLIEGTWYGYGYAVSEFALQNIFKYINGSLAFVENVIIPTLDRSYRTYIQGQFGMNAYTGKWDIVTDQQIYGTAYPDTVPPPGTGYATVYAMFLNGTLTPNAYLEGCPAIFAPC